MGEQHLSRGERVANAFWRTQPVSGTDFRIVRDVEHEEREAKRRALAEVSLGGIACPPAGDQFNRMSPLHIELRKRGVHGLAQLAVRSGFAYATLAAARRTRRPSAALLRAVAKALGLDVTAARVVLLLPSSIGRPNESAAPR